MRVVPVLLVLACQRAAPPPVTAATAAPVDVVPMSDPAEYDIDRISRDAGRAIFERTGIGDPYRTGIPYPMFLALLRAFPGTFGASTGELADRFGFVARAPDPASSDADVRAGLPVGMHLTIDPMTNVPFVVTSCALCHAEKLRWRGGEALVVGLGNKRVRIHAYDRAFADITKLPGFTAQKLGRLADEAAQAHRIAWPPIPITDLGTDPMRLLAATEDFERAANDPAITRGFTRFRRGTGYVPPVLTNVWARAPYGHAGQWPSLAMLALPPAQRPTTFHLDLDGLYDLDSVGVAMRETPRSFHHDALQRGFAVGGHPFLSDLAPTDRAAVIEYLKTL